MDVSGGKRKLRRCFIGISHSKALSRNAICSVTSLRQSRIANGAVGQATFFLLKIIALETVRRFSKSRCPFAWRGLQALQIFCYPPFKWIQRWAPFRGLVKGMQVRAVNFSLIYYDLHIRIRWTNLRSIPIWSSSTWSNVCWPVMCEQKIERMSWGFTLIKHVYIFKLTRLYWL